MLLAAIAAFAVLSGAVWVEFLDLPLCRLAGAVKRAWTCLRTSPSWDARLSQSSAQASSRCAMHPLQASMQQIDMLNIRAGQSLLCCCVSCICCTMAMFGMRCVQSAINTLAVIMLPVLFIR